MDIAAGADNFLLPKTQKGICKGGRNRQLPILRKDNMATCVKVRHVTFSPIRKSKGESIGIHAVERGLNPSAALMETIA